MTYECTCKNCDKKFQSQRKDSTICYGCALAEIIGNGGPEEGDINTALIISGEMSDAHARSLQEDLESIDHSSEEVRRRQMVEDYSEDFEDHRWDYPEERNEDE